MQFLKIRYSECLSAAPFHLTPHYGPAVDSASNKNEYQEYSLGEGVKAAA
jgi:hypothetical protein